MNKLLVTFVILCHSFSFIYAEQGRLHKTLIPTFKPDYTSVARTKDLDNDGDPDLLFSTLYDSIPVIWIDDDDDMKYSDKEGDLDNDCLLIDRNNDGIFVGKGDLSIDWVDTNNDGIADMQVVVDNSNVRERNSWDWQSNYMWIIDPEQDEIFNYVSWDELLLKCWAHAGASNFYVDYHGQTLFQKVHVPSYRYSDLRYSWENPFLFYDPDDDGYTEMSIRMEDSGIFKNRKKAGVNVYPTKRIDHVYLSFDIDNDNGVSNEFDFDMSIRFEGSGFSYEDQVHKFPNMRGLQAADSLFYDVRWRKMDELVYTDHEAAWDKIYSEGEWEQCWLVFDEDDDCERWERVELYEPESPFKIGQRNGGIDNNPQADATGDRGEWDLDNSGNGKLYVGIDNRMHLFGAELGYWRMDFGAQSYQGWGGLYADKYERDQIEPQTFPTVEYWDKDSDGFFDKISYDLNGDTIFEYSFDLNKYNISTDSFEVFDVKEMTYDDLCVLYQQCAQSMWQQAQKAVKVAEKYDVNHKWYAFFLQPRTITQKYNYGYWLQFYLFYDLLDDLEQREDEELKEKLIQAYFSQNWEIML